MPWFAPVSSVAELRALHRRARPRPRRQAGRQPRQPRRAAPRAGQDLQRRLRSRRSAFADRARDGRRISRRPAGLDRVDRDSTAAAITPGFSDRNYELLERYAPYFIENGGDLPSHLPPRHPGAVKDCRGARRQRARHPQRQRQGRHRRRTRASPMSSSSRHASPAAFSARARFRSTPASISSAARSASRSASASRRRAEPKRQHAGHPALRLSEARPRHRRARRERPRNMYRALPKSSSPHGPATSFRRPATSGLRPPWCLRQGATAKRRSPPRTRGFRAIEIETR